MQIEIATGETISVEGVGDISIESVTTRKEGQRKPVNVVTLNIEPQPAKKPKKL